MKLTTRFAVGFLLCWAVFRCAASDDYEGAVALEKAANQWKKDGPIPAKLLKYRTSHEDGSCFPNPRGTEVLFPSITNYSLLREIIFLPRLDARVFSNAVNSAVTLVGPTRFFSDSLETLTGQPELARQDRFKAIQKQAGVKHVVVDSRYSSYADMAPDAAKKVLDQIAAELQTGKAWQDVYWKFMEAYEYPWQETPSDGTVVKGKRPRIGNLGDFVLPANGNPLFSYREDWMPKGHIKNYLRPRPGTA